MPLNVCKTIGGLELALADQPRILVPTMGALHTGHAALIQHACGLANSRGLVVVSIFVNPAQFGPGEDYLRYPRQLDRDIELCELAGADVIFAPSVHEVYPAGHEQVCEGFVVPALPDVATQPQLEDQCRPGHFAGVIKVVARLFDLVQPNQAVFGEKDYQQLRVIIEVSRQQASRWSGLRIVSHPTIREPDGLAMSSRNVYLRPEQRETALSLWRALTEARQERTPVAAEDVMRVLLEEQNLEVDYAAVRDAASLMPVTQFDRPCRALIAARIGGAGGTRVIDNMPIGRENQ